MRCHVHPQVGRLRVLGILAGVLWNSLHGWAAGDFARGIQVGQIHEKALAEISGVAASRNNPGVLWVHNDRARGQIYAVNTSGAVLAVWDLNKSVDDVEDIAIGPGPSPELEYLYCGDIGDNAASRANIHVLRAAEPSAYSYQSSRPRTQNFPLVDKMTLVYPDGPHNAEGLMVDPWTGDVLVVTKEPGIARIYRASQSQLIDGATVTLSFVTEIEFDVVSAADISRDGRNILLRQEDFAEMWTRSAGQTIEQAFQTTPVFVPVIGTPLEPNGEGVGWEPNGVGYFTVSEGADPPIYFFARTNAVPAPRSTTLLPLGSTWHFKDDGTDQGTAWRTSDFSDTTWLTGAGQFGYGEDDERTTLRYGSDKDRKYVTTYFRTRFTVEKAAAFRSLVIRAVYDDGIAVYLNGAELLRRNLASGASFSSAALASGSSLENLWQSFEMPNLLVDGTNVLAVEVHRASRSEADLSFDLQVLGINAEAALQFNGPPRRLSANQWLLEFDAPAGVNVFLESSSDLRDWTAVGQPVLSDGTGRFSITEDELRGQFYRLRQ